MSKGLNEAALSQWLADSIPGARAPFDFQLIAAGGSNLTYRVQDQSGSAWVLRRPPVAGALATAHDMQREWRIMKALALHACGVRVPAMVAFSDDLGIIGAAFYVMEFVDGLILRDRVSAAALDAGQCRLAMHSLVDTQIAFHTLDPAAVGLGDLGLHANYVGRQLRRWRRQVEAGKTRDLPLIERIHDRLAANIPVETQRPGLAHGDYRFDNTVLGTDFRVRAVLDWELCTIGDPLADFFWSLMYWADPRDDVTFLQDPPTRLQQFPRRAEVRAYYAERSGFDLAAESFYLAFGWWKQACIVEGVYARLVKGGGGGMRGASPELAAHIVERYLDRAEAAAAVLAG